MCIRDSGYLVSWCIGHLISFADAGGYKEQYRKWNYDDLPIVPQDWQFTVASGKEQQFSVLKDLMQRSDVSEIVKDVYKRQPFFIIIPSFAFCCPLF